MPLKPAQSLKAKLASVPEGELLQNIRIIREHLRESEQEDALEKTEEAAKAAAVEAKAE